MVGNGDVCVEMTLSAYLDSCFEQDQNIDVQQSDYYLKDWHFQARYVFAT